MDTTNFCIKLADLTREQHYRYHMINESDKPLSDQIQKYWTDLGLAFPGVGEAWSAVFVSWCILKAGAKKTEFKFSARHSTFVYSAIANQRDKTGLFRAHEISKYAPKIGDIIQNNRLKKKYSYSYAEKHDSYSSHSAIVTEIGIDSSGKYALTTGGNESDSVRNTIVRLDANGFVRQRETNPYICVIENLK